MERFGRLDVHVTNAGTTLLMPISKLTQGNYNTQMDVNRRRIVLGCQKALPAIKHSSATSLIKMSSVASMRGIAFVYSMVKAGIHMLRKSVAIEHVAHSVRCNSVYPRLVDTNMQDDAQHDNAEANAELSTMVPLARIAKPDEITDYVLFLASDELSYIKGMELVVDGGLITG